MPMKINHARVEDERLLKGLGCYVRDIALGGMLYAAFVRSSYAHAKLLNIDCAAALAVEGVKAVLQASDLGVAIDLPPSNPLVPRLFEQPCTALAIKEVGYVGQPIALVIAQSEAIARAAADLVDIAYEPLDVVLDDPANPQTAPMFRVAYGAPYDVGTSSNSVLKVTASHSQPRLISMSLEPRGLVAAWSEGRLTLWLPSQSPSRARDDIAHAMGLSSSQVRVICPDVGGAFGAKGSIYPEDLAIAFAAKHLNVAISWAASRSEEFVSAMHGRGSYLQGELVVSRSGEFLHLKSRSTFTLGAWLPFSAGIPVRNAARILPGPYEVGSIDIESKGYVSNAAPMNIYRGAGRPEAALLMERLVDEAARCLKTDPVQLRKKNLIAASSLPKLTATGERLDSGDYTAALENACRLFDYDAKRKAQLLRRTNGELIGIGVAVYIEPCGQGWESARVTLELDGTVTVASGSVAQGQGHETSFATIASHALGCEFSAVRVVHGDTDLCPEGIGSLASRSTAIGGSAIVEACEKALALKAASQSLPIVAEVKYVAPGEAWSYGCVIAQMTIDRDTGVPLIEQISWVDDAGLIVTPTLAHGQLIGGAAQGLGQAMMEKLVYDENGQLITGSLMDYAVPRADNMPPITIESLHQSGQKTSANRLGAKGVGEAGCIGVPAALLNAAYDALSSVGDVSTLQLNFPLSSEQLWRAMNVLKTKVAV
jgi:aerobic carbon-monoxide dehydrogenase large subunit